MDTEDRDHFKTIANHSALQPNGSQSGQTKASKSGDQDQAYFLRMARILFACYRKDEAHDADMYCSAVAAVLSEYTTTVVERTCDPRTGVASELKFLPSVAEVRGFCDRTVHKLALLAEPRRRALPFVPPPLKPGEVDATGHAMLVAKKKALPRPIGPFERSNDQWNRP